jgi:hypothetical protein
MATLVKLASALEVPIEALLQQVAAATRYPGVSLPSQPGTLSADAAIANALSGREGLCQHDQDIILALIRALAQDTTKGG